MMTEKRTKIFLKFLLFGILLSLLVGCIPDGDDEFSLPRDKYIGNWLCQDANGAGYYAIISSDPSNSTQVIIGNFFAISTRGTVTAIVTDATITVPNQVMQGIQGTYHCEGIGSLYGKNGKYTIEWRLYAANDDETTSIYTKQ